MNFSLYFIELTPEKQIPVEHIMHVTINTKS